MQAERQRRAAVRDARACGAGRVQEAIDGFAGYPTWTQLLMVLRGQVPAGQLRRMVGLLRASHAMRRLASEHLFTSLEVGQQRYPDVVELVRTALLEAGLPRRLVFDAADAGIAGADAATAAAALARLMPTLERLYLNGNAALALALPSLRSGAKLLELRLPSGHGVMAAVSSLTSLTRLELWDMSVNDAAKLRPLLHLKSLLIGRRLKTSAYAALPAQLTELRVDGMHSPLGVLASFLAGPTRLAVLDLGCHGNCFDMSTLGALSATLVTLRLDRCVGADPPEDAHLQLLPRLAELSVKRSSCAAWLHTAFPALRKLALYDPKAAEGGAPLLFDLPLEELSVSIYGDTVHGSGLPRREVRLGPRCRATLTALDLHRAWAAPADVGELAPRLRRLRISIGRGSDFPAAMVPSGLRLDSLEELHLLYPPQPPAPPGAEPLLRAAAASAALRRLSVPASPALPEVLRGAQLLQELYVHRRAPPHAELLQALAALPGLRRLSLAPGWEGWDAGAAAVLALPSLSGLRELGLRGLGGGMGYPTKPGELCQAIAPLLARMPHLERVTLHDRFCCGDLSSPWHDDDARRR